MQIIGQKDFNERRVRGYPEVKEIIIIFSVGIIETIRQLGGKVDKSILAKIAKLYYNDGLTQSEISKELDLERSRISRLLKQAKELGIVKISINESYVEQFELGEKIKKKYNLKDVVLVDSNDEMIDSICERTHDYLQKVTYKNEIVGIAWGRILCEISKYKPEETNKKLNFVALTGGYGNLKEYAHINEMVYNLSKAYKGESYFIDFPLIVDNANMRSEVYKSKFFERILNIWDKLGTVLVGIGSIHKEKSVIWESGLLELIESEYIWDMVKAKGAVGDICTRFYGENGQLETDFEERTVGINIEKLKNMKNSIGIAVGETKTAAIKAAIKNKYINILISDVDTGRKLL